MFAIRGLVHGMVSQVVSLLGVVVGLVVAGWVAEGVRDLWRDAEPAVVFMLLRWLIVACAALTVATLMSWWGELLGRAVKSTPAGWMDRTAGFGVGAALGATIAVFALMAALLIPVPRAVSETAAEARMSRPMMEGAARACSLGSGRVPGCSWLGERFTAAARRASLHGQPI